MNLYLVACERCVVCSEFEADGLHGCHFGFDHMLGPTGIVMCLPYPVAIAAIYSFVLFLLQSDTAAQMDVVRSIITDKCVA
jgi:hypothetical protein